MQSNPGAEATEAKPQPLPSRLGSLIGLAGRQWRKAVDVRLGAYDLSEATWLPLLRLARASAPMRQKDLALALSLDSSSVVRLLCRLETAGLIERGEDSEDRRAKALVITAAGRALVAKVERVSEKVEREVLAGLSREEIEIARTVLRHVCLALPQTS